MNKKTTHPTFTVEFKKVPQTEIES